MGPELGEVLGPVGVRGPDQGFGARWRSRGRTESQAAGVPGLVEGPGSVEVPGGIPGPGVASPSGATAGVAARGGGRRPER